MAQSKILADRLSKLSPEKRALLEKRLQGRGRRSAPATAAEPVSAAPASFAEALRQPPEPLVDPALWRSLVAVGERAAAERWSAEDLRKEAAMEPALDRLAVVAVSLALYQMGVFREPGERYTADQLAERCAVLPDYRRLLRRWLLMLTEEGFLVRDGEAFVGPRPLPAEWPDDALSEVQETHFRDNLPAMMRGASHPLEFFIPGGSSQRLEKSYTLSPTFRYCNGVSAELVRTQVEALPPDRRLRVLEIGAGTGGTTVSLLPELPAERSIYLYTDISRYFTDLGRNKFSDYPFLRYAELNVEADPVTQGLPAGSFDWIVAAHVLHATRDLGQTVAHVARLLAPGGILLLLEETRFLRKFNFTMGFLPGFDRFEDEDLRQLHPLLSSEEWRAFLLAHGFSDFASFTDPEELPQVLGVDVMIARRSPEAEV